MPEIARCFILQRTDPATGSAVAEARIFVKDVDRLRDLLGAGDDPDVNHDHRLEDDDVAAIGALCDPPVALDPDLDTLTAWHPIRQAPYLVHTGFELPLMLEGRKPMAVFSDVSSADWLEEIMTLFAPHVREGGLCLRVSDAPARHPPPSGPMSQVIIRHVFYALPGEEWRIDAYLDLWRDGGWSDAHERREGELLGYENWQNDWWIQQRKHWCRA